VHNIERQRGWSKRIKASWTALSQIAIWIMSILGSFLLPPPIGVSPEDQKIWQRLARFIVTILVGLLFVAARGFNKRKHLQGWTVVAGLLLVLAVADFLIYQSRLYSTTCSYNSKRVLKGSTYTPHGLDYFQKHPGVSCEYAFEEHAGRAEDIWTEDSIVHNRMILAEVYIGCLPLFAICIVAILQAVSLQRA
jgi:hypothetical protein